MSRRGSAVAVNGVLVLACISRFKVISDNAVYNLNRSTFSLAYKEANCAVFVVCCDFAVTIFNLNRQVAAFGEVDKGDISAVI